MPEVTRPRRRGPTVMADHIVRPGPIEHAPEDLDLENAVFLPTGQRFPHVPKRLIAFDLDGTLITNHVEERECPRCGGSGVDTELSQRGAPQPCERCGGKRTTLVEVGKYEDFDLLPGRALRVRQLRALGGRIAICTNQGGVAFGYHTEEDVWSKATRAWHQLGFYDPGPETSFHVSVTHPNATIECYRADSDRRKPGPGMIREAMLQHHTTKDETLYVGDMDSDRLAAEAAGVEFRWAHEFFGDTP